VTNAGPTTDDLWMMSPFADVRPHERMGPLEVRGLALGGFAGDGVFRRAWCSLGSAS
jgi:hypothetical protein